MAKLPTFDVGSRQVELVLALSCSAHLDGIGTKRPELTTPELASRLPGHNAFPRASLAAN
jgi:hypothetical protein